MLKCCILFNPSTFQPFNFSGFFHSLFNYFVVEKQRNVRLLAAVLTICTMHLATASFAQTATDGFIMEKGRICIALPYQSSSWTEYWEGTLKRENLNLGEVKTQALMPMAAVGILNNLNVLVGLPFFKTSASAGSMSGHQGIQDLALGLKYRALNLGLGESKLEGFVTGMFSTPASNYYPDFLPLSIGLGSTNLSARGTLHYQSKMGLYGTAQLGWTRRSNIKLERNYYYENGGVYSSEMIMPNVLDYNANLGFYKNGLRLELGYSVMNTLGGPDIRRNDMPLPCANMDLSSASFLAQYYPKALKGIGFMAMGSKVLEGRNVGQSTMLGGGILYQFQAWNKAAKTEN